MAQRRMIHKAISYSKQVNGLQSDFAKLLFTWMVPHLDDFGKIDGDAGVIKAIVMPMSDKKEEEFETAIEELVNVGLIQRYEISDQKVIRYPTFDQYQTGLNKRTQSKYPDTHNIPRTSENFKESITISQPTEPKSTEENLIKANQTEKIADKNSFKTVGEIVNPKSFIPKGDTEFAALETWKKLEPDNPLAFQTTYLKAARNGLPPNLFYMFASEIRQDSNIKNRGAVFNTKVEQYLSRRSRNG